MKIIIKNNKRILVNYDKKEVDISDDTIIEYIGIYYKPKTNSVNIQDINVSECRFIGKIEISKKDKVETIGIYIMPLYLWDKATFEWVKINNYEPPKNKYFLYPHLLMLPDKYYHHRPLYFLHTCKQIDLSKFTNVTKTINLHYINY